MKILSALPFERCENCSRCIMTVKDERSIAGEKTVMVRCRHAEKCIKQEQKGGKHNAN